MEKTKKLQTYKKAATTIAKGSLEHKLQRQSKLSKWSVVLLGSALGFGVATYMLEESEKTNKEMMAEATMYTAIGLAIIAFILAGISFEPLRVAGEDTNEIGLILKDLYSKQTNEDFNRELVKLAPVIDSISKHVAEHSPENPKDILGQMGTEKTVEIVRDYLKTHPKDAEKFLGILAVANVPQKLIDRYISEFMPNTISFDRARSSGY